jgi:hypothetical protein
MVIKHTVLRKLFGPWRLEVTGGRRKCYANNPEMCLLPNIIRIIQSRKTRWAGHLVRKGETRNAHSLLMKT